ncbi:MAG: hypothetical protein R3C03_03205 [Pirellulaceae bacterium]
MRRYLWLLLAIVPLVTKFESPTLINTNDSVNAIAFDTKNGVEVRINQLQMQRIGATATTPAPLLPFVKDKENLQRTIAFSLVQSGQGKISGTTTIELIDGTVIEPFLFGNQRLMSVVANSEIPNGFEYSEYWYCIPDDTDFRNIFPINITHKTTDKDDKQIVFKFEGLEP